MGTPPGVPDLVSSKLGQFVESLVRCNSVWIPVVTKANPGIFLLARQIPHLISHPINLLPLGSPRQFVTCYRDGLLEGGPDGVNTRYCRSSLVDGAVSI